MHDQQNAKKKNIYYSHVFPEIHFSNYVRELLFDGILFTCEICPKYKL